MTQETTIAEPFDDPFWQPAGRPIHMAAKVNSNGGVSALCFVVQRKIDLRRATWTLRPDAVTCPKCKQRMAARAR